ncbi:MAG: multiheme c-type cytochrome [Polyangiales bacterium]
MQSRNLRASALALLCLVCACAGATCDGAKPGAPQEVAAVKAPRADLRLLITTDPRGYLEPCGCQLRPLGGLDKLATLVAEARGDGVPTLLVAAGNTAFGTELRPEDAEGARDQERFRAETFADVYRRLGFRAVGPGPIDLAQDRALVAAVSGDGQVPWLLDNGTPKGDGAPPIAQARVVDAGGVKVGLLGLSAPNPAHPASFAALSDDLARVASEKSEALRKEGAQLVVALVSGDRRLARQIAGRGADVVVMGGLDLEKPLAPAMAGDGVLLHAGQQGQYLLSVDLGLKARGPWEDASEWTRREARKELERQLAEQKERIASWEKDPNVERRDLDEQRARLGELERALASAPTPRFAQRWLVANLKEIGPEVKAEPTIAGLIDAHDKRVNEHNRTALADLKPTPAEAGKPHYAGSASCASCHAQADAWWKQTKHGNAYATLEEVHKEFNLSCVGCHVTGYNLPGGSTVTHVETLKNVGCESCHGPGSAHNERPNEPGLIMRDVGENVCTGCHTHEHSDHFVYNSYKAMLIVPGHGLPSDRK